jgi:hypothetical protein
MFATSLLLKIGIFLCKKGLFTFKVLLTDSFLLLNCGVGDFVSTFGSSKTFRKLKSVYMLWMCLSETANWYFLHSSISSEFVSSSHSSIFYYLLLPNFFITPSSYGYKVLSEILLSFSASKSFRNAKSCCMLSYCFCETGKL